MLLIAWLADGWLIGPTWLHLDWRLDVVQLKYRRSNFTVCEAHLTYSNAIFLVTRIHGLKSSENQWCEMKYDNGPFEPDVVLHVHSSQVSPIRGPVHIQ